MNLKREKMIAYGAGIVFFVVGVVCYAAFPEKPPEEPVRIMLANTAGNVLFNHKQHTSDEGYGYECTDCHHEWKGKASGTEPQPCQECHKPESEDPIKTTDAYHMQCVGCHEEFGAAPVQCSECHVPL